MAALIAPAVQAAQAPAADAEPSYPAAHPKGKYGTLEKLPDWGGVWVLAGRGPNTAPREQPVLKGQYLAEYEAWRKEVRENNGLAAQAGVQLHAAGHAQHDGERGNTPSSSCSCRAASRRITKPGCSGATSTPTDVRIPTTGTAAIFGHSIGHWEGTTLVIDTIGIKTITELGPGIRHSDKLHITERVAQDPKDPKDVITWQLTMEDPEALEKPYRITHTYKRQRDWALLEFVCAENDRNPVGEDGHTKFE